MVMPQGYGPPAGVSAGDLWSRLMQAPRPFMDFKFPRRGVDVAIRIVVLTEQELMNCRVAADRYAKAALNQKQAVGEDNVGYHDIYRNESVVQVVCTACRDPNGQTIESRAFPSADMARAQFTGDELAVLFNAYCDFQLDSGPIVASMTTEEMDAWLDRLAEGASRSPLAALSSAQRDALLMRSVSRHSSSPTASTSVGSPPNVSSASPAG